MMIMIKYVALLRGINVGGNKQVKMGELRRAFEKSGFSNVKTLLNSGNVVFETNDGEATAIAEKISILLEKEFGHKISVLVRSVKDIQDLINNDPFKGIAITPQTRLVVTFLTDKPLNKTNVSFKSKGIDYRIVRITDNEICSVLNLGGTTDLMTILETEFGKKVTTRTWGTVKKIPLL